MRTQITPTIVIHNSLRDSIISRTMVHEYFPSRAQKKKKKYQPLSILPNERRKDIESAKHRLITTKRLNTRFSSRVNFFPRFLL